MWISVKGRHLPFNSISQGTFWSILRNEKEIKDWYRSWLKEIQLWSKCFTWHHYRRNQHLWYYASSRAKEAWHRRSYTLVFYLYSAQSGTTHTLNSSPSSSWKQISNTNSLQPSIWREILHPASLEGCDPITEVYNKSPSPSSNCHTNKAAGDCRGSLRHDLRRFWKTKVHRGDKNKDNKESLSLCPHRRVKNGPWSTAG